MCGKKATVMVVSNDFMALDELGRLLGRKYNVIGAADDAQHITPYVQSFRPDAVVVDTRVRELERTTAERLAGSAPQTKLVFWGKANYPQGCVVQDTAEMTCALTALLASGPATDVINEPDATETDCTEIFLG